MSITYFISSGYSEQPAVRKKLDKRTPRGDPQYSAHTQQWFVKILDSECSFEEMCPNPSSDIDYAGNYHQGNSLKQRQ